MKKTLQEILLGNRPITDGTIHLYYHAAERLAQSEDKGFFLKENKVYDFSTYYNMFSLEKWRKYCNIKDIYLELDIAGSFYLELMGYYVDKTGKVHRESVGRYFYDGERRRKLTVDPPAAYLDAGRYSSIAFKIEGGKDCILYAGRYFSEINSRDQNTPEICMLTKAEDDISFSETDLFDDTDLSGNIFRW